MLDHSILFHYFAMRLQSKPKPKNTWPRNCETDNKSNAETLPAPSWWWESQKLIWPKVSIWLLQFFARTPSLDLATNGEHPRRWVQRFISWQPVNRETAINRLLGLPVPSAAWTGFRLTASWLTSSVTAFDLIDWPDPLSQSFVHSCSSWSVSLRVPCC